MRFVVRRLGPYDGTYEREGPLGNRLVAAPVATKTVSAELHPDPDGSLAIWLASGDYALLGSTQLLTSGAALYEVVAVFPVPAGAVAAYDHGCDETVRGSGLP